MPGQSLFAISDDLLALDDLIHENQGNLDDPAVAAALEAFEEEIVTNMESKVDNYAAFIRSLVSRADIRKEEANRLADRAKIDKNAAKRLAERLKYVFELHNVERMDTPRFRLGIVNNGGAVPLFIDCDYDELPPEYQVAETVITPNLDAIRQALAAGTPVPGCRLGERGRRLAIR